MTRLFIAEKPSLAGEIATVLGITKKEKGFYLCGNDVVTYCFGHMLEQEEPDFYTSEDAPRNPKTGQKLWRVEDLPIIPQEWIWKPKEDDGAKAQLAIIGRLLKDAKEVVNAGDPDREGQLLIQNVLAHFGNRAPVKRFWILSNDAATMRKAIANLQDDADYTRYANAAMARGRSDWLIGMNMSRAFTLRAQRGGANVLLPVGRVQTPTLNLVVVRDREIEAFKPVPFHTLTVAAQHANGIFLATWKASEDQAGLDPEGRLTDTAEAEKLIQRLTGKAGSIQEYMQEKKVDYHPQAFSLADISLTASKKFRYGVAQVLEICQALYDKKYVSYPRTDNAYLPESLHADAPLVLAAVRGVYPAMAELIDAADTSIKSKTWNDSKVTAHYGLIPTVHEGSLTALSEPERNIYDLIVRAYIAQFYPTHKFLSTKVTVNVEDESFFATGKTITENGWRDVAAFDVSDDEDEGTKEVQGRLQVLPAMERGNPINCVKVVRKDTATKAPSRFTQGTLQDAMKKIAKFVANPEHRKILRESDGIGTSATQAATITELLRRKFIEQKGNAVISTPMGRGLIDAVPEVIKSPVLTAIYERTLKEIENGKEDPHLFISKQEQFVREQVEKANNGSVVIAGVQVRKVSTVHKCPDPACKKGLVRHAEGKSPWWGCSGYPVCKTRFPDIKGQPNFASKPKTQGV